MKRFLTILFIGLSSTSAAADGVLSGYVCGDLPKVYRVDVEVSDDSKEMLRIRDAARREIAKSQPTAAQAAMLVLSIDLPAIRQGSPGKKRSLGSVSGGSGSGVEARTNIWSNRRDSVIGGRKEGGADGETDSIQIDIALNDKSNGKCIWRGDAVHAHSGLDRWIVAEKAVLKLIGVLGRDVRDREFSID